MMAGWRARAALTVIGCLLALVTLPATALAAFPGKNGLIAYARSNGLIYLITADGREDNVPILSGRDPAWSPDGNRLAYVREGVGLYIVDYTSRTNTRIVADGSVFQPTWSPDGTELIYVKVIFDKTELYRVNSDGTGATRILDGYDAWHPDWSPDGSTVIFQACGTSSRTCVSSSGGSVEPDIVAMNPDGTNVHPLTGPGEDWTPTWAPSGSKILFDRILPGAANPGRGLTTMNPDGTGLTRISMYVRQYGGFHPASWSPDGTRITMNYLTNLYVLDSDGSDVTAIRTWGDVISGPDWQLIPVNSYPRPKAATPIEATLVPAYAQCTSPNRTHGPPLAYDSCNPPTQASDELTLGTPDANAKPVRGEGFVRYQALSGTPANQIEDADVRITVELHDVYTQGTLMGYTGELKARTTLRITDKLNTPHPGGPGAATVSDTTLGATVPCAPNPTQGADCAVVTSADALAPGTVIEGRRAVWELGQVQVDDGGADGDADSPADNTPFMVQGVFVP